VEDSIGVEDGNGGRAVWDALVAQKGDREGSKVAQEALKRDGVMSVVPEHHVFPVRIVLG
jgi:hypothetical protein